MTPEPEHTEGRVNENEPSWYELDWPWDEAAREPREWMR